MARPSYPDMLHVARRGVALVRRFGRRLLILLIDAAFLAYLFVMGSYVATGIASGAGLYLAIPGGFVVLLAVAAAVAWGALGTSVGLKAVQFLSGSAPAIPQGETRKRLVPGVADRRGAAGVWMTARGQPGPQPTGGAVPHRTPWHRTLWGWSLALAVLVTLVAGTVITRADVSRLVQNFPFAAKMIVRLFRPDWTILGEVVSLTLVTVFMALIATLLAIPVAVALSFPAARNLSRGPIGKPVYFIIRALASVVRSIEPIIWAIVFVIWVRMGPFAGALALFVCSIADLVKLYSEQLESIDTGPTEAITAVGGRRLQVLLYGIVPQIINPYLSFTLYRWDINVRMGTVIGMVGGGGIGSLLMQYVRVNAWEQVSTCVVAIIVVVWSIDTLSARLRERLS